MKIINLYGGPGAGKTTFAYYLAYRFKAAGFRAELVGEAARELIYDRNHPLAVGTLAQLLDNQLLISGLQYERLKRLERHKMEVVIADSPLRMGLAYAVSLPEYEGLRKAIEALEASFPTPINVWCQRTEGKYDKESRAQSEKESMALDEQIRRMAMMNFYVGWHCFSPIADAIIDEVRRGWN